MKTTAAVLVQIGKPLEIQELELPALKKGQVLVEIHYSGLCHTQLNEIKGLKGEDKYLPHTLGHEGSGIIIEIGEGVTKVQKGDHVVLS
ncbi:MAG: alcohol dehydrogenase catalytic domain-containing protein, partial [Chlamydiota bacterium]